VVGVVVVVVVGVVVGVAVGVVVVVGVVVAVGVGVAVVVVMTCLDDSHEVAISLAVATHCATKGLSDTIQEEAAQYMAMSCFNNKWGHFTRDEAIKVGTDFADRYAARLIEKARQK
jgi:hypothetical protein